MSIITNIKSKCNDNNICHLVSPYYVQRTGWSALLLLFTSVSQIRKLKQRKLIVCPDLWDLNPVLFDSRAHTVNYTMSRTWGTIRGFITWSIICILTRVFLKCRRNSSSPFEESGSSGYFRRSLHVLEVSCCSRQFREKSSHLRLHSIYLNSAKFTQFIQKRFEQEMKMSSLYFYVYNHPPPYADPRAWPMITKAEHVQISVRAKQSSMQ